ncbi:MAG TPA: RDD family protein [Candidatus Dormibacteraeota bacterium]|nr:RDD family protein [Candidatus Dormibacteraeota bacterium]
MAVAAALSPVVSRWAAQARQARWPRLRALLLDFLAFSIVLSIVNWVYAGTLIATWGSNCVLWVVYYVVPESLYGASVGKLLLGLCVVRADGQALGVGSIVVRNILRFIDVLPGLYLIGGLSVLMTADSQRVGDRWAGTTIVRSVRIEDPHATRHPPRGANRLLGVALVLALLFTIGFDYFGRPALVLEDLFYKHQLMAPDLSSYELGTATWSLGRVTYPLTGYEGTTACSGSISLQWEWPLGWTMSDGTLLCPP